MATYVWLTIVGTLGSWAVLVPSKFVEGKLEDQVPMRITLMLLGALLGLIAWGVSEGLMIRMTGWHEPIDVGSGLLSHEMLDWPQRVERTQSARGRLRRVLRVPVRASALVASDRIYPQHAHEFVVHHRLRLHGVAAPYFLVVPATDGNDHGGRDRARDPTGKSLDASQPAPGNQ